MSKKEETKEQNLTGNIRKLSEISEWFEKQEEVDVEEGLKKVKEAAAIIKASRERLKVVENEFEEIKKEMDVKEDAGKKKGKEEEINVKDIPF